MVHIFIPIFAHHSLFSHLELPIHNIPLTLLVDLPIDRRIAENYEMINTFKSVSAISGDCGKHLMGVGRARTTGNPGRFY